MFAGNDTLILRLRSKSMPLDAGSKIELKFDVEAAGRPAGEMYLRIDVRDEHAYEPGQVFAARFVRLP